MTFPKAISTCLLKYFDFKGRASRSEYWWFYLFVFLLDTLLLFLLFLVKLLHAESFLGLYFLGLYFIVKIALISPTLAVGSRRLHDTNRSGWWLLSVFTIIGIIPLVIWLASKSSDIYNQYGSSELGNTLGQNNLGILYYQGQGVPQDYAQAASWYRKSAEQGNALAQNNQGSLYYHGQGVPQDYAQAASWFRKAAEQGDALAQYNLGLLYDHGQGVPQDYAQAASWFRKAAGMGNALAQNNLGLRYDFGQGMMQSNVIAYALYNVSATNYPSSDNPATKNRANIAARMSNQEISVAQRLTAAMMNPKNLLAALDGYERNSMKRSK